MTPSGFLAKVLAFNYFDLLPLQRLEALVG